MEENKQNQPASKPDPETLHTTDPEEHMKGPISSAMQSLRKSAEENDHPDRKDIRTDDKGERANDE